MVRQATATTEKNWYVVHTYAGYENKVKANLESRITSMDMEDKIFGIVIPVEDVVEIKGRKKTITQKRVFPGYILVEMRLDDDSWFVVRNTPGVTGFVGAGAKPTPLSQVEVDKIIRREGFEKPKPKTEFEVGQSVRVIKGPFVDFSGKINEIEVEKGKLKVYIEIFGRETLVELGFDQVAKL
jgi:transcriptional antiterminator NusG